MTVEKKILETYGLEEILCQTVEECAELSKECVKLRRVLRGTTDCDKDVVIKNILEEVADVLNCIDVLTSSDDIPYHETLQIGQDKMERWERHAKEHKKKNENRSD